MRPENRLASAWLHDEIFWHWRAGQYADNQAIADEFHHILENQVPAPILHLLSVFSADRVQDDGRMSWMGQIAKLPFAITLEPAVQVL